MNRCKMAEHHTSVLKRQKLETKNGLVSIVYKTELKGGYAKVAGFYKIVALHLQQTLENGSLH